MEKRDLDKNNRSRKSNAKEWLDFSTGNISRDKGNPDILVPPSTDHGTIPILCFSYSDAYKRLQEGCWTCKKTNREISVYQYLAKH